MIVTLIILLLIGGIADNHYDAKQEQCEVPDDELE